MRIVVMYDLPVADAQDRHEYSRFRQFLVGDGYTRLQNSVYTRLAVDTKNAEAAISRLKASASRSGAGAGAQGIRGLLLLNAHAMWKPV